MQVFWLLDAGPTVAELRELIGRTSKKSGDKALTSLAACGGGFRLF